MTSEILLKRPGGYGESSILELNPDYEKYRSRKPFLTAFLIAFPILLLGLLPFVMQIDFLTYNVNNPSDNYALLGIKSDYTFGELGIPIMAESRIFDFVCTAKSASNECLKLVGPFGTIAILLSLFIPISIALFLFISYKLKTKDLIKSREKTKKLEEEFTSSLFQLGNRIGDGIPAEIAFSKVAESTQGQATQQFFLTVNQNIQQLGMSLDEAIFNKKRGAIIFFPSQLISTSMRILVESVKKGLQVAARSLMSISEYVKNIQKINQRLKDLLAEIVSDMKSNMTFLAPLLAGIVIGLGAMISLILLKLRNLQDIAPGSDLGSFGSLAKIVNIFDASQMVSPYFLQIIVGIYLVEIIFILTSALVTVDSGKDPLKEKYDLSNNLKIGISMYIIAAGLAIISLSLLASIAIGSII